MREVRAVGLAGLAAAAAIAPYTVPKVLFCLSVLCLAWTWGR